MLSHLIKRSLQRERLLQRFSSIKSGAIFLKGGETKERYDTDTEILFRQESNFWYLTGVDAPGCSLALNLSTKEFVLFVPELDDNYALWCGDFPSNEEYKEATGANRVLYNTQVKQVLLDEWKTQEVYVLRNIPKEIEAVSKQFDKVDNQVLYKEMTYIRLRKTEDEIAHIRKVCEISSEAHKALMKAARPGINEAELEATLIYETRKRGCIHQAYNPIIAGETRGATLHYVDNNKPVNKGLVLVDAGGELNNYASDITRTFPVSGKYSKEERDIYEIVLKANKAVIEAMKPGVSWVEMHRLTEKIIAEGLLSVGILQGSLEEVLKNHVQAVFFPHGIGHALGLDVHDPPNRDGSFAAIQEPGIRFLRVHCTLEEGIVLTVEPGIYFNQRMINAALKNENQAKLINQEKLAQYMSVGGIRVEDNVVVTKTGVEVFTTGVPKEIAEIEALMAKI